MKQKIILLLLLMSSTFALAQERAEVLLETTEGNIRLALYNETPLHRDNFLKLVRMHVYDSLLFHRVVKDFMIQGGDLNSKHAQPGQLLGTGDLDYTIEPEFRLPQIFHRRGVLAAAREPDDVNPEMRSAACQFYIVWGRQMDDPNIWRIQDRLDTLTKGRVKVKSCRASMSSIRFSRWLPTRTTAPWPMSASSVPRPSSTRSHPSQHLRSPNR